MSDLTSEADALRHKLIADLFDLPVWHQGKTRCVTPCWQHLTVEERDLIAAALAQWRPEARLPGSRRR